MVKRNIVINVFLCVFSKACNGKSVTYVRVHICGSCAEFVLEGPAKKFCFIDFECLSSANTDFWLFIAKRFSGRQLYCVFPLLFPFFLLLYHFCVVVWFRKSILFSQCLKCVGEAW